MSLVYLFGVFISAAFPLIIGIVAVCLIYKKFIKKD